MARRRGRASLTARATLALLLMAGFYLLALAIIAGLSWILYLEGTSDNPSGYLVVLVAGGIIAIVAGIFPRRRRFVEPGPPVGSEDQPDLFDVIGQVAEATGSPMPRDVYIVADVNAGVAHVGGFAGMGARPIMMLGLPLIAALTVSELRGVMAHEFGHYAGGETKLAPVIYRTREAIGRTIETLARSGHWLIQSIHLPFLWYGRMYMRATQAISRRQELAADAMAARIAGGTSMERGLVRSHAAGLALRTYMNQELGTVLSAGYRPPVAEGFSRFLAGSESGTLLQQKADDASRQGRSDPFDSHPSLKERLDALKALPHEPPPSPDPPATDLLRDQPDLETRLLTRITGLDVPSLEAITWDEATARVWLVVWERLCTVQRAALKGITSETLPSVCLDLGPYGKQVRPRAGPKVPNEFLTLLGAALTVVLSRRGWAIDAGPGDPVTARSNGVVLRTFEVPRRLAVGQLSVEEWQRTCSESAIADLDLAQAAMAEPRVDAEAQPS